MSRPARCEINPSMECHRKRCPLHYASLMISIERWADCPMSITENIMVERCDIARAFDHPDLLIYHLATGRMTRRICDELVEAGRRIKAYRAEYRRLEADTPDPAVSIEKQVAGETGIRIIGPGIQIATESDDLE